MNVVLLLLALAGHAFLWIGLINRLHAIGMRRAIVKALTLVCFLCAAMIPLGGLAWYGSSSRGVASHVLGAYAVLCGIAAPMTLLRLAWIRAAQRRPSVVRFHGKHRAEIDPAAAAVTASESLHHPLVRLPWNEILQLEVTRWTLELPRLPPALEGLTIVQLSDFHYTGRVGKAYFREVVRASNELRPDLLCITGDIIDREACLDWIPETLGRLTARHGVYCILGNHDRRIAPPRLRRLLADGGLVDLGGRWLPIQIGGTPLLLAGNERPWFQSRDSSVGCVQRNEHTSDNDDAWRSSGDAAPRPLRIVLAHTPDQLGWARQHEADLMLAGHTHGGQICIPPLGAIFSPTAAGVKYISGIFYAPPTILHVSRGLSGDIPVRWNCRPEIAVLELRRGT
jgi:uncharacterized protein